MPPTLIQTCELNTVNSFDYLTELLLYPGGTQAEPAGTARHALNRNMMNPYPLPKNIGCGHCTGEITGCPETGFSKLKIRTRPARH